jgi:hypothetical protein
MDQSPYGLGLPSSPKGGGDDIGAPTYRYALLADPPVGVPQQSVRLRPLQR